MSARDKCGKCVKDGIQCSHCDCAFHLKCANIDDDLCEMVRVNLYFKWFCDGCLRSYAGVKVLIKSIETHNKNVVAGLDEVKDVIQTELKNIKSSIDLSTDKIDRFDKSDVYFGDKINCLKKEINATRAEVVGREIKKASML